MSIDIGPGVPPELREAVASATRPVPLLEPGVSELERLAREFQRENPAASAASCWDKAEVWLEERARRARRALDANLAARRAAEAEADQPFGGPSGTRQTIDEKKNPPMRFIPER